MKIKRLFALVIGTACSLSFLSGCAINLFEKEIKVVFMNEGEIVDTGSITQFKNYQSPKIDESYVPSNYKFLGWTAYSMDQIDLSSAENLKKQYIAPGRMVHYKEAQPFAKDGTTTYEALMLPVDDIPKEYHYAVVAWYDKAATSGLNQDLMDGYVSMLKTYLTKEGVSDDDINTIVFRGYSGNVGPTTGQILYDGDVDIMFGWGSLSNITTTGSIPEESVLESVEFQITYNGEPKNRHIHRLTDSVGSLKVMDYLKSQESIDYFNK